VRVARRVAVLATAGALLAGCFGDDPSEVHVEPVRAGDVTETVSAPGRVAAAARQDVVALLPGVIEAIEVTDGQHVEAGQVILRLRSDQVELARDQAAMAQQGVGGGGVRIDSGGNATRQAVTAAVGDLDAAVQPDLAEARARTAEIADPAQRAASEAAIAAVERSYLATRAALLATGEAVAGQQDVAARALTAALNQALEQSVAPARAQAAGAAAAAEAQAGQLVVHAPFSGTVQFATGAGSDGGSFALPPELASELGSALPGELAGAGGGGPVRTGAAVTAGQVLLTVYDLSERFVEADIDEFDAPAVAAGQAATVVVDAFPDAPFDGVVESIRVEAAATATGGVGFPARVRLVGEPARLERLRVGMTGSVEIAVRDVAADLVIPSRALLRRDGETVVLVVRDGVAVQAVVTVEALGEEQAAVTGDLRPADQVIVAGYEDVSDGDRVRAARSP
jgi:multidrug efflux pump subunit AcrA (membrane-fusion protein)